MAGTRPGLGGSRHLKMSSILGLEEKIRHGPAALLLVVCLGPGCTMARDTESSRADAIRVAGCETILTGTDPFNSVAVLGDDGIYLAQPGIQAVLALAPPSWATTVVGRVGAGPGEYVRPMEVFALSDRKSVV